MLARKVAPWLLLGVGIKLAAVGVWISWRPIGLGEALVAEGVVAIVAAACLAVSNLPSDRGEA